MEKEFIVGLMGNHIKGNFLRGWSKATDFGKEQNRIHILEHGDKTKLMVMGFIFGWVVIDMKDHGKHAWEMGMVLIFFKIKISTQVSIFKDFLMDTDNMNGKMEMFTAVILIKVWNKEKVNGNKNPKIQ